LETIIQSLEIPELGISSNSSNEKDCFAELEAQVCSRISFSINFFRFLPKSLYLI
jgi:hypothetical protein